MAGCDTLVAIYDSMYGKAPMHMIAREEVIGLPDDVFVYCEDGVCRVAQ